jgi:Cu/Zn superoxide dismutase
MRKDLLRLAPLLCAFVMLPACGPRDTEETPPAEETAPPPAMAPAPVTLSFIPDPAHAAVTGTLRVTAATDGSTEIVADLTGLTPGEHAWHIHSAPCGTDGPIAVAISATTDMEGIGSALNADATGHATGTATVAAARLTQDQLRSGQYAVHVHEGTGTSMGPSVACVTIQP